MKKTFVKLFLLAVVFCSISFAASAQIYVKIRPKAPVVVRTPAPSRAHVWINEEWEPNQGNYRYSGGHWAAPPSQGARWRQGHWKHSRNGNAWVKGNWRKGR